MPDTALETRIEHASAPFGEVAAANMRTIAVTIHDIDDILHKTPGCPVTLSSLQRLIHAQASLHRTSAVENLRSLRKMLESRGSTLRGFVLHGDGIGPIAYAVYFPMIDHRGDRAAYCEDFFIAESMRGHGVADILFYELARKVMDEGATKLQWATDKRNEPVHGFVTKHLHAKHPDIITIAASDLLKESSRASELLRTHWNAKDYITRPLTPEDSQLPNKVQLSRNIIRATGDLSFRGFVTFRKGDPSRPVAITPGWTHLSTFRLREGIHLEHPSCQANFDPDALVASIAIAARKYIHSKGLSYLRWHVPESDDPVRTVLREKLILPIDSMLGDEDSQLIVYELTNGALTALAQTPVKPIVEIPNSSPIGTSARRVISTQHPANI